MELWRCLITPAGYRFQDRTGPVGVSFDDLVNQIQRNNPAELPQAAIDTPSAGRIRCAQGAGPHSERLKT